MASSSAKASHAASEAMLALADCVGCPPPRPRAGPSLPTPPGRKPQCAAMFTLIGANAVFWRLHTPGSGVSTPPVLASSHPRFWRLHTPGLNRSPMHRWPVNCSPANRWLGVPQATASRGPFFPELPAARPSFRRRRGVGAPPDATPALVGRALVVGGATPPDPAPLQPRGG
eukprot:scaffold9729_cov108-Isochrysis_galbana.AAC.4